MFPRKGGKVQDDPHGEIDHLRAEVVKLTVQNEKQSKLFADTEKRLLTQIEKLLENSSASRIALQEKEKKIIEQSAALDELKLKNEETAVGQGKQQALLQLSLAEEEHRVDKVGQLSAEVAAYKVEISVMALQIKNKQIELHDCKKELEAISTDYRTASHMLSLTSGLLDVAERKCEEAEKQVVVLSKEKDALSLQLRANQQELFRVCQELSSVKNRELWDAMEREQANMREASSNVSKLEDDLANTKATLSDRDAALAKFKSLFRDELAQIRLDFMMVMAKIEKYKNELQQCMKEKEKLAKECVSATEAIDALGDNVEELEQKLKITEKEANQFRDERDSVTLQLRACQQELRFVSVELSSLKNKAIWDSLEQEQQLTRDTDSMMAALKEQNDQLRNDLNSLQKNYTDFLVQMAVCQQELRQTRRARDEFEKEAMSAQSTVRMLEESSSQIEAEYTLARRENSKLTKDNEFLEVQVKAAQRGLGLMNQELSLIRQKELWEAVDAPASHDNAHETTAHENVELRSSLESRDATIAKLSEELATCSARLGEADSNLLRCRRELKDALSQYHNAQEALSNAESLIEELESKLNASTKQIRQAKMEKETTSLLLRACQAELRQVGYDLSLCKQREIWDLLEDVQAKKRKDSEFEDALVESQRNTSRLLQDLTCLKDQLANILSQFGET